MIFNILTISQVAIVIGGKMKKKKWDLKSPRFNFFIKFFYWNFTPFWGHLQPNFIPFWGPRQPNFTTFWGPPQPNLTQFGVPDNCSSGPRPGWQDMFNKGDPQMEWNLVVGDLKTKWFGGPQNGVKFSCWGHRNGVKFGCWVPPVGLKFKYWKN